MDRRTFVTLAGAVGAGLVVESRLRPAQQSFVAPVPSTPLGPRLSIDVPGMYRVAGVVRLEGPTVEISGITNTQSLSWSRLGAQSATLSSFVSFEEFDTPGVVPDIQVRGGRLESLSAVLID
jgi:hypothetical protein